MRDLEWKAKAAADLMAIVDCNSDANPDAAEALKEDIEAKVTRLRENPNSIGSAAWPARERWS